MSAPSVPPTRPLRVLLIPGSLRSRSTNLAVLKTVAAVAPPSITTTLYSGLGRLPHFNPDDDREGETVHHAVAELRSEIDSADALLICTPEYAGALPGALKNLLEWTVGNAGTYRKPIAWINASGPAAPTGGADAHDSLRKVLNYVGADLVEAACRRIPITRDAVDRAGMIADQAIRDQLIDVLGALAWHCSRDPAGLPAARSAADPGER